MSTFFFSISKIKIKEKMMFKYLHPFTSLSLCIHKSYKVVKLILGIFFDCFILSKYSFRLRLEPGKY